MWPERGSNRRCGAVVSTWGGVIAERDEAGASLPDGRTLYWLGAHGGAGTTTVRLATGLGAEAPHLLPPATATCPVPVVVVARTHARGLIAAQELAALAAGPGLHLATAYDLAGLVLVADAPGKLPKPLAELAHLVSGGYPRTWRVPYVDAWRLGEPPSAANTPDAVARIGQDLAKASAAIDLRGRSQ
jgi:hypothetical protein